MKPKQGGVISRVFSYGMMLSSSIFVMSVWLYFLGSDTYTKSQIITATVPVFNWTCQNHDLPYVGPFFLIPTPQQCSLPAYSPPTGSCHCNEIINAIDATCLSLWRWGWWVFNLGPSIYRTASERNQRQQQWICQTFRHQRLTSAQTVMKPHVLHTVSLTWTSSDC